MKIEVTNLKKIYNKELKLNIESLTINSGEIFGLVGNNGAGKTTFFRLILDLIKADSGIVLSDNNPVNESLKWKEYTGSFLDSGFLIEFLTPEEYFYFVCELYNITRNDASERLKVFENFFNGEILGKKGKYIRDFSRGNQQKIGIASALITHPKMLILDEPFNGLDPTSQIILKEMLKEFNKSAGATILISSHDLTHISETCTRIALLEKGKIIKDIPANDNALAELLDYFGQRINLNSVAQ